MIKKASEMIVDYNENMRGGMGTAQVAHIFTKEELKGNSRLCAKITLKPGCSIGTHTHEQEEEIYYILKGSGLVIDDGVAKEVTVGEAILTRDGASHSIENTGNEDLEFMAIINLY